jgi:hypothetical protein
MPTSRSASMALSRAACRATLMQAQCFFDVIAYGVKRVEAGHRLLKNHRDFIAANGAHLRFGVL